MLAVHSEKLLIADGVADAALNRLTGKVTDIVYQGESLRVFLQLADGTCLSLRQPSHYQASRLLPPVGGELTVTLHPEDTIVVPKAQEKATGMRAIDRQTRVQHQTNKTRDENVL